MKKILTILLLLIAGITYGQTWTNVSSLPAPNPPVNSMSVVDANTIWVCCDASGGAARVYLSTNGGTSWNLRAGGLAAVNSYGMFAFDAVTAFVGNTNGTLYKTTNGGNNWTQVFAVSGSFTNGVHMFNTNYGIYYGDPTGSGVPYQFRVTTDGGNTWVVSPTAPIASSEFGVINAWDWTDSSHVWIGSANTTPNATTAKVFKTSTGFYGTWSNVLLTGTGSSTAGPYFQAVAFNDNMNGMVGSSAGEIYKTVNGGTSYTAVTPPAGLTTGSFAVINMHSVKADGTIRMCIVGDTTRVFKTTNLGTTWIREWLPLQATLGQVQHMQFLNAGLGYAALGGTGMTGGLIKYTGPSGINNNTGEIPAAFSLSQNYPNPFNPSTMISFALPKSGMVTLKIYNSLGKEVETLVNENMAAGNHEITFNASGLTSGIYFYRINANGFTDTKKMMLVK
ncbi:MAG: T9SS type A sorting domain-containing protein [Ignavibacteria bacterium]|nr:T9SS type A sorting domain-containing protein [Ignavibacteria bacterium]